MPRALRARLFRRVGCAVGGVVCGTACATTSTAAAAAAAAAARGDEDREKRAGHANDNASSLAQHNSLTPRVCGSGTSTPSLAR